MKFKLYIVAMLAIVVASCTIEDLPEPVKNEGNIVTIRAAIAPETRVSYTDGATGGTLAWEQGDQLKLAGYDGTTYKGESTFTWSGTGVVFTGPAVPGATAYKAYYPASITLDANGNMQPVTSTFWEQTQNGTSSTAHLRSKLILIDDNPKPVGDLFTLVAKNSIIKFDLSIPNDLGTLTKLIWKVETITGLFKSMTLNVSGVSAGTTSLIAFLAFDPAVMKIASGVTSGGEFNIKLIGSAKSYEWSTNSGAAGKTYDAGKRYTATVSGGWTKAQAEFKYLIGLTSGTTYDILQKSATASPANLTIDWGDNSTPTSIAKGATLTTTVASHNYAKKGDYTITIYSDEADHTKIQIPQIIFPSTSAGKYLKEVLTPFPNMGVTDFTSWFEDCPDLTSIAEGLFQNHPNATTFHKCFASCGKLASIPLGLFYNNISATTFSNCFANCIGLTTMPQRMFRHSPNAVNFYECFYGCTFLELVPTMFPNPATEPNFFFNRGAMDWTRCFDGVGSKLAVGTGTAPQLWLYNRGGTWTFTDCFKNAKRLSNFNSIPSNWGGDGPVYP